MDTLMRNDRGHQLRMLKVCYELNRIRETLLQSTKLFPEVDIGENCVIPEMAVTAYTKLLSTQINLMLSLIEGEEGIDYPAEPSDADKP